MWTDFQSIPIFNSLFENSECGPRSDKKKKSTLWLCDTTEDTHIRFPFNANVYAECRASSGAQLWHCWQWLLKQEKPAVPVLLVLLNLFLHYQTNVLCQLELNDIHKLAAIASISELFPSYSLQRSHMMLFFNKFQFSARNIAQKVHAIMSIIHLFLSLF